MNSSHLARRLELVRAAVDGVPSPSPLRPVPAIPATVRRVLRFIEQHRFDSGLTVRKILRECGVRNHNVSSQFSLHVGMGIRCFLEETRLRAAQELLESSDIEIYLIAFHVGYAHVETFNRAFRRSRGVSPGQWRERRRER